MKRDDDYLKRTGYEDLFVMLSTFVEKWLVRTILGLLVLLVFTQVLLQFSGIRYYLVRLSSWKANLMSGSMNERLEFG